MPLAYNSGLDVGSHLCRVMVKLLIHRLEKTLISDYDIL